MDSVNLTHIDHFYDCSLSLTEVTSVKLSLAPKLAVGKEPDYEWPIIILERAEAHSRTVLNCHFYHTEFCLTIYLPRQGVGGGITCFCCTSHLEEIRHVNKLAEQFILRLPIHRLPNLILFFNLHSLRMVAAAPTFFDALSSFSNPQS